MRRTILIFFLAICWAGGRAWAQDIGVKTNILYWATSTPNLGFEFGLGKRTTLDLAGGYNPWTLDREANRKIRHWMVMPEFRYWLCERFNGHFFGVHSGYAFYNLSGVRIPFRGKSTKDHRYQAWASPMVITGYLANGGTSRRRWASVTSIRTTISTTVRPAANSGAVRTSTTSARPRRVSPLFI